MRLPHGRLPHRALEEDAQAKWALENFLHLEHVHHALDAVSAKDAEQVVLQAEEVARAAWISLPASRSNQKLRTYHQWGWRLSLHVAC